MAAVKNNPPFSGPSGGDENPIGQRLKYEMKARGITSAELAKRTDVKTSFIYDVISGKSANPSTVKLARVAEGLGITLASLVESSAGQQTAVATQHDDYLNIPWLASAQDERHEAKVQPYCFSAAWIKKHLGVAADDLRLFAVNGDSMEPTLCHKDILLVNIANQNPTPPGIFIVFDGYAPTVKRIERVMHAHSPRIRIVSDNPQYSNYETLPADAVIIGRVVWFARGI